MANIVEPMEGPNNEHVERSESDDDEHFDEWHFTRFERIIGASTDTCGCESCLPIWKEARRGAPPTYLATAQRCAAALVEEPVWPADVHDTLDGVSGEAAADRPETANLVDHAHRLTLIETHWRMAIASEDYREVDRELSAIASAEMGSDRAFFAARATVQGGSLGYLARSADALSHMGALYARRRDAS